MSFPKLAIVQLMAHGTRPAFKPLYRFLGFVFLVLGEGGWVGGWVGGRGKNVFCIAAMPKSLVQHTVQGCGTRHVVASTHAFGDHAQNRGISSVLPLCTTYCARMWNKTRCHKHIKHVPASAASVWPDEVSPAWSLHENAAAAQVFAL